MAELHGLATDRETGKAIPIGTDEQKHSLRVWHFAHDPEYAADLGVRSTKATYIQDGQDHVTVLKADKDEVMTRWNAAVAAKEPLNALDLNYPSGGVNIVRDTVNSNSAYRSLSEIMGVAVHDFAWKVEPGLDNRMVGTKRIEELRTHDYPVLDAPSIKEDGKYKPLASVAQTQSESGAGQQQASQIGSAGLQADDTQDITRESHRGHLRYQQALHAIEHSPNIPSGAFSGERLQQTAANLAYASLAGEERQGIGSNSEVLSRIDFAAFNKQRTGLIAGEGEATNPSNKLAFLSGAQDNAQTLAATSLRMDALLQDPQKLALANPALQPALTQSGPEPEQAGPKR